MKDTNGIELIKKGIEISWAWFLEYHEKTSKEIASKVTNRERFKEWEPYFDIKEDYITKPRKKTIKTESITLNKKYTPSFRESEEEIQLNKDILKLIKLKKSREEICNELEISEQKLGHKISKLKGKEILNINPKSYRIDAPYSSKIKKYRLGVKAFIYYAKGHEVMFNSEEEKVLRYMFDNDLVRVEMYKLYKNINFIDAITKFYAKYFILDFDDKNKKALSELRDEVVNSLKESVKRNYKGEDNIYDKDNKRIFRVKASTPESDLLDKELSIIDDLFYNFENKDTPLEKNNLTFSLRNSLKNKFLKLLVV